MAQRHHKILLNVLRILKIVHKVDKLSQYFEQDHQEEVLIQVHPDFGVEFGQD